MISRDLLQPQSFCERCSMHPWNSPQILPFLLLFLSFTWVLRSWCSRVGMILQLSFLFGVFTQQKQQCLPFPPASLGVAEPNPVFGAYAFGFLICTQGTSDFLPVWFLFPESLWHKSVHAKLPSSLCTSSLSPYSAPFGGRYWCQHCLLTTWTVGWSAPQQVHGQYQMGGEGGL